MSTEQTNLAPTCVNHPKVETRLTCSNCGDPICTRCMVTTAVGQKCPRCAKQSGRAKGNPEPQLLARAFGAGLAVATVAGILLVVTPFAGFLLAIAHGFVVGAAVRWAARRRTHVWLGLVAVVAVLIGLGGLVLVLGGNPFAARLLLAYALSAGVAFARASGAW
jgi:thiol:disulfide interchange protein